MDKEKVKQLLQEAIAKLEELKQEVEKE